VLFPCFKQWLNTQTLLQNSAIKEETKIDDYEKDSTHYIYFTDSHDTSGTKQTHYERKSLRPTVATGGGDGEEIASQICFGNCEHNFETGGRGQE
jgi:hypothetical protein